MNPVAGNEDRPILVIYIRWDDLDYPPGIDAASVANAFFGSTGLPSTTFPSVGDYFRRLSFNRLYMFPAQESEGTYQDGVVQITVPGTRDEFFALSETARNKRVLELADQYVDFASFDLDSSGAVSPLELVVNVLEVAAPGVVMPFGCGIARGVQALSLDGVNLGGLAVSMNNTSTNFITIVHENAHVAMDLQDFYGFDVGRFDLGGITCNLSDSTLFAPSAWHKLHWGWITPTVVTQDGYYDVRRADTSGDAFILYDPSRGTGDYFLVENRRPTPQTYDRSLSDDGLVIWRVADDAFGVATPIGLMRPTPIAAAWDASDPFSPQRTMSSPWFDGTASNVAVRAISAKGEVMRAYFDVPGPGVLVDPYPLDAAQPVKATAAGQNLIDVPLMNTAETGCDTFVVEAVQLPPAWTMSPGARILCAGESSFARVTVTPDANAAVGIYAIAIRGRSLTDAAVTSEAPLRVEVVLRSTKFGLDAFLAATTTGTTTTFTTRVSAEDDPRVGIAGVPVTFSVTGPQVALTLAATTDANGVATATTLLALPAGAYTLTITSERLRELAPSRTTVSFEVLTVPGTIQRVADELAALRTAATNPDVRVALAAAIDDLIGNNDGTGSNGALHRLAGSSATSALVKLRAATGHLALAESRGAGDLWRLKALLARAAEGITTGTP